MLVNYFKIIFRRFRKNKLFFLINIAGLTIGLVLSFIILQYIYNELSYDKFHKDWKSIYRVKHERFENGQSVERLPRTFSALSSNLSQNYPEVQTVTRFSTVDCIVSYLEPGKPVSAFKEKNVLLVDKNFLSIFNFPLVSGSAFAGDESNTAIIDESTARKIFGNQDPVGKILKIQNHNEGTDIEASIKGICKDVPSNSHFTFHVLVSDKKGAGNWTYPSSFTYIKTVPGANVKALNSKIVDLVTKNSTMKSASTSSSIKLELQPLKSLHLYSDLTGELSDNGNGKMIWLLSLVAGLILFIAYTNYINLTTVKALERAREVGLRKVFGSNRAGLIKNFTLESLVLNVICVVLAVVVVYLSHQYIYRAAGISIDPDTIKGFWSSPLIWIGLIIITLAGTFISGLVPALMLSSYQPVQVLRGQFPINSRGIVLRKVLILLQFAISIGLIFGTFVVNKQVNYMLGQNQGIDITKTIVIEAPDNTVEKEMGGMAFQRHITTFSNEVRKLPGIQGVTMSSGVPGKEILWSRPYKRRAEDLGKPGNLYPTLSIGPEFLDQFKIKLIAGQNFKAITSDVVDSTRPLNTPILINEAAVQAFKFEDNNKAIGQILMDKNGAGISFEYEIVGVVQNFHQKSLKETYSPIVFRLEDGSSVENISVKIDENDIQGNLSRIESNFKSIFTSSPFEYFFLDDYFGQQYKFDRQFSTVFSLFTGFAIFVSCLGLFGLSLFTIMLRTREIGMRKVLGASNGSIVTLVFRDFFKLILISCFIALPLAWWSISQWLLKYAFRVGINPIYFGLSAFVVLLVAFLTVGLHTWRTARLDPVRALKNEG